jgi:regulator of nucleoside diphosphate kinase
MTTVLTHELPAITITKRDFDRLSQLTQATANTSLTAARFLAREMNRARVCADHEAPSEVVSMGAEVQFRDDVGGELRWATLVYPSEADLTAGKISILTPIGAALIGLSVGQSISFQTPAGGWRSITVTVVRNRALD